MIRVVLAALLLLAQNPVSAPTSIREQAVAIAQGATPSARRAAVVDRLKSLGVTYEVQQFTAGTRTGENIVATVAGKQEGRTLLLGAHLDRVAVGQGVVDNGASCVVLLELIERLKAQPLENTFVTVVFFDLEEGGLLGSRAYFQLLNPASLPSRAINLDIFGYGDTLFVTPSKPEGTLLAALLQAAVEAGLAVRSTPLGQYPASDHQNMARAGIETLGLALIDGSEIDAVIGRGGNTPPRILTLIHSAADTIEQLREQDIAKAIPVLEKTVRLLDAQK